MTKREAWKYQEKRYRTELAKWEADPPSADRTHNIGRLKLQIERHNYPENRPK